MQYIETNTIQIKNTNTNKSFVKKETIRADAIKTEMKNDENEKLDTIVSKFMCLNSMIFLKGYL